MASKKKPRARKRLSPLPKPLPTLSRRLVYVIGTITTYFSILEDLMRWGIVRLFFRDEAGGWVVISQLEYRGLRDIYRAWISILNSTPAVQDLETILTEIERLNGIRVLAAHAMWIKGRKRGSIKPISFRARGTVKMLGHQPNEKEHTAESLAKDSSEILRAYGRLRQWIDGAATALQSPIPWPPPPIKE